MFWKLMAPSLGFCRWAWTPKATLRTSSESWGLNQGSNKSGLEALEEDKTRVLETPTPPAVEGRRARGQRPEYLHPPSQVSEVQTQGPPL